MIDFEGRSGKVLSGSDSEVETRILMAFIQAKENQSLEGKATSWPSALQAPEEMQDCAIGGQGQAGGKVVVQANCRVRGLGTEGLLDRRCLAAWTEDARCVHSEQLLHRPELVRTCTRMHH